MNQSSFISNLVDEMHVLFKDSPQALENTLRIAESCDLEIPMGDYHLPRFPIPGENGSGDGDAFLRRLCLNGLKERYV